MRSAIFSLIILAAVADFSWRTWAAFGVIALLLIADGVNTVASRIDDLRLSNLRRTSTSK